MPVRFRCRHCNQLIGIARRKIGAEVSCPTCSRALLVPAADSPDVEQPTVRKAGAPFEGSERDALLHPSPPAACSAASRPAAAWPPSDLVPPLNVDVHSPAGRLVLSPFQATVMTVGMVLLLALFFAGGLLIGRFCF